MKPINQCLIIELTTKWIKTKYAKDLVMSGGLCRTMDILFDVDWLKVFEANLRRPWLTRDGSGQTYSIWMVNQLSFIVTRTFTTGWITKLFWYIAHLLCYSWVWWKCIHNVSYLVYTKIDKLFDRPSAEGSEERHLVNIKGMTACSFNLMPLSIKYSYVEYSVWYKSR